jgi:hypothetical protein
MTHRFQCQCGRVAGEIDAPRRAMRAVCYCRDCQTYAHLLGQPRRVLDALGGTDVVATHAKHVRFTRGLESLACVSLSPNGLLRWYARCCSTPIANTPRDWKLPYVGFVHTCLRQPDPLERDFPKVEMRVNVKSAHGAPPRDTSPLAYPRFFAMVMRLGAARLAGGSKEHPLFGAQGAPVVPVQVADRAAVEAARRAAAGA